MRRDISLKLNLSLPVFRSVQLLFATSTFLQLQMDRGTAEQIVVRNGIAVLEEHAL